MIIKPHIHIAGVGGVGMSALAEALLALGYDVSGSDRTMDQGGDSEAVAILKRAGLRLAPQDGSALTPNTYALAVSTAIESDNPELLAARRLGIEVVHRAAMLARLASGKDVVAITGTAGKTTVTALVGWLLEQAGFDPTVVNGGIVLNWRGPARLGNVRIGRSNWWVIEADESDRSLLNFHPAHALITNASKDHFELAEVQALFQRFAAQVRGTVVAGPGVAHFLGRPAIEPVYEIARRDSCWLIRYRGCHFETAMPGRHNAENAALAIALCDALGAPLERLHAALPSFRGVHRRLEVVGLFRGARVIDDYAHNPAKMAASWRAAAEGANRVIGWWRPHGFAPLALMMSELVEALAKALRPTDRFFVLPVFYAGGTVRRTVTSEDFVAALRARGVDAELVETYSELRKRIDAETRPGDVLLGMGARDPELPRFARSLVSV
ncbi:MAG: Mur ligase domain-containing protein [Kiritimatiellae bacterium]|nr:Mur ligase domain-containing protein [Kiritimatiellia bacterium]MDW8457707.1 Mur ligase domain-containing protein [Verrucomicrobiota bacterium]